MKSTDNLISREAQTSTDPYHIKYSMSDSEKYSFLAICAICLSELFPCEWDANFNQELIRKLCQYFRVNKRIESVILVFVGENSNHKYEPYIELLVQEKSFNRKAIVILQHAVLSLVQSGEYDARQRVLVRRLAELFKVPFDLVELYEHSSVNLLKKKINCSTEEEKKEIERRDKTHRMERYASVGIATVAGGTLIGLTGGLAAPFIGIGFGTILGSAGAAALTSTTGVAIIGSIFGVTGAGLTGYKMNKRVGQVQEFCFEPLSKYSVIDQQLHIAIAVSGWLNNKDSNCITKPWRFLNLSREQYALRYETKYLVELGQALEYILNIAISFATQEALKYTVLSGLMSAIAWPTVLLSIASVIDNPWSVCCRRSSEVGKHLAHVLLSRQHGKRPVTLIGYSLGARVIFYCLRELSELSRSQGIIQDAIMLGAPVTNKKELWGKCSRVVAGQIINGYCRADWLLKFLYRTLSMTSGVAGLMPIDCLRIKNIDLGSLISGHIEYSDKLLEIIEFIGIKTRPINVLDGGILRKSISVNPAVKKISNSSLQGSKSDECLNVFHH